MKDDHNDKREDVNSEPEPESGEEEVLYDEDGQEEGIQTRIKRLRDKLKRSEKEREENLTGWQRAKADYVNLKKRETAVREEARENATEEVVAQIFPLLDSFESAFSNESWEGGDEGFKSGIESIYKQFLSTLKSIGVEEIGSVGEQFDPHIHTSVSTQETDDETKDDTIAEVLQKGYRYNDRVIRSPKVTVFHYKQ